MRLTVALAVLLALPATAHAGTGPFGDCRPSGAELVVANSRAAVFELATKKTTTTWACARRARRPMRLLRTQNAPERDRVDTPVLADRYLAYVLYDQNDPDFSGDATQQLRVLDVSKKRWVYRGVEVGSDVYYDTFVLNRFGDVAWTLVNQIGHPIIEISVRGFVNGVEVEVANGSSIDPSSLASSPSGYWLYWQAVRCENSECHNEPQVAPFRPKRAS